ncbi:RHS repeat-associated core domain-containing protein [Pseudomonas putida]|uniref:RHS repeat-associated core domain-containing protein n=1 Tax=Pseudomonas putida TaxID=303 RepID=UPI003D9916B3
MLRQSMNLLRSYRYDPLDRLVAYETSGQASTQRFYLRDRLATEIQGTVQHSIMQHGDQLLAQQQRQGSAAAQTSLLATDQQRSVLTLLDAKQPHAFVYMPYGHCLTGGRLLSLLGFNGERADPVTGWYLLGNGHHRPFNPVLMRFNCPDSWSPFGDGGLNTYAYCGGDPINRNDRTGHAFVFSLQKLKFWKSSQTIARKSTKPATADWLKGSYRKTEEFNVGPMFSRTQFGKNRQPKNIDDAASPPPSYSPSPPTPPHKPGRNTSASREIIASHRRVIERFGDSLQISTNTNYSELTEIAIDVLNQRSLNIGTNPSPASPRPRPRDSRNNIHEKLNIEIREA